VTIPGTQTTSTTPWQQEDSSLNNFTWGALKALVVARGGQALGLDKILASGAGAGVAGGTAELLTLQKSYTTTNVQVAEWYGEVGINRFTGNVEYVDFQGLGDVQTRTIDVQESYRIMLGNEVLATLPGSSGKIPNQSAESFNSGEAFPLYDVRY